MRLHTLELENINSLRNVQTVDFERLFENTSILLIAGKTGSGKSTILDAIHLALFGRTPRLPDTARSTSVDSSVRHVMTRGAGRCHVKLEFSVLSDDGVRERYRAYWQLRRAREKPDGNFQEPTMTMERLEDDGETWADLLKRGDFSSFEAARSHAMRGMNEDDFLRSVMLAQGKFDTLLSADNSSRAEALKRVVSVEQIQRIGKQVADNATEARNELSLMVKTTEMKREGLLTDELRAEHKQELSSAISTNAKHEADIKALRQRVQWASTNQQLVEELVHAENVDAEAKAAQQRNVNDAAALHEHSRVAKAASQLDALQTLRARRSEQQSALTLAEKAVKSSEELLAPLQEKAQSARTTYDGLEVARKEREPMLVEAEQAWEQLQEATRAFNTAQNEQKQSVLRLEQTEAELKKRTEAVAACKAATSEAQTAVQRFELDDASLASLPTVEGLRERMTLLQSRLASETTSFKRAANSLDQANTALKTHHAAREELNGKKAALLKTLRKLCDASGLPGFEELDLRSADTLHQGLLEEINSLVAYGKQLAGIKTLRDELRTLRIETAQMDAKSVERKEAFKTSTVQLEEHGKKHAEQVRYLSTLRELLGTQDRFLLLIEQLKPGSDCPLCGADEHKPSDERRGEMLEERERTQTAYSDAETAVQTLDDTMKREQAALQKRRDELTTLQTRIQVSKAELEKKEKELQEAVATLKSDYPLQTKSLPLEAEALEATIKDLGSLWRVKKAAVEQAANLKNTAETLREEWAKHEAGLQSSQDQQRTRVEEHTSAGESLKLLQDEVRRAFESADRLFTTGAFARWAPQAQETMEEELVAHTAKLTELVQQLRDFATARATRDRLLEREADAAKEAAGQQTVVERVRKEKDAALDKTKHAETLAARALERSKSFFNGQSPRDVRVRFDAELSAAREQLAKLVEELEKRRAEHERLKSQCVAATSVLAQTVELLEAAESALREELARLELPDEDAVRVRRLDEEQAATFTARTAEIAEALKNASFALTSARERLKTHQAQRDVIGEPKPEDADTLANLENEVARLIGRIAELTLLLKTDAERAEEVSESGVELARLTAERDEWEQLNKLVGVRGGAVFSEFALVLSLGTLIAHANEQLKHIAPRYVLRQRFSDDNVPLLDFEIIDRDFSDQIRPITNISGGERFQLSLAMALGLSSMSRSVLPIETLLIDEGFGTLDPDTLDQAIQTLEGLYQRTGARVALISHVERLRERLPTQIVVKKLGGGHSKLEQHIGYGADSPV